MNNRYMKYGISALCIAALALLPSGCKRTELEDIEAQGNGAEFAFSDNRLSELKSGASEASGEIHTITLKSDTDEIVLYRSERSSELELDNITETKGTPVTTDNLGIIYKDELYTRAYTEADHNTFLSPLKLAYEENKGGMSIWRVTKFFAWPKDSGKLSFWAWAPNSVINPIDENIKDSEGKMTFTYTMPAPGSATKKTDAEAQQDIILGHTITAKPSNHIAMTMDHALTALRFEMDNTASFKVKSITLGGVYSTGTCTYSPDATKTHAYEQMEWSNLGTKQTYTQDFNQTIAEGTEDAPQEIGPQKATFMVIPQCVTGGNVINFDMAIEIDGETKHYTTTLKNENWKAGVTYTYGIDFDGYEYEFKLVDETQSNISYVNTSNSEDTNINVTSTLSYFGVPQDADWKIKSYTNIATGVTKTVDGTSFNEGSFSVYKNGKSLKVSSLARTPVDPGSHSFWKNENDARKDFLDWSPKPLSGVTDLSKFNFRTEQAMAMTTANCYIIRHAGTYKIPLVYGNAVKDGTEYTDAYSPDATGGDYRLAQFKNHLNNAITSAFIENNDGCIVDANKCTILWQDKAAVVSDLSIVGDVQAEGSYDVSNVRYLQFKVDESTISQSNALLAIKDNSGNIIWSWHIWVSNNPAVLSNSIRVTNSRSCSYDYFPVTSLGWLDPSYYMPMELVVELVQEGSNKTLEIIINQEQIQANGASGTFYQFGRKDPFYSGLITSPAQGSAWTHTTVGGGDTSKAANYAAAIKSPTLMYTYGYTANYCMYDWCKEFYYNVWSGKATTHGAGSDKDDTFTKTVYDPSPAGFMVPPAGAFSSFQDSAILKSDGYATCYKRNGEDKTGISFSDVGSFTGYDCVWNFYTNQFASGYYWSSSSAKPADMTHSVTFPCLYDNQYCFCIVIANGWGTPDWAIDKAFLCAVRPVEE